MSIEDGIRQFHGVRAFFAEGSFNLREFVSNSPELNALFVSENAAASNLEHAKILGLHWNTLPDTLSLPPVKTPSEDTKWTKRLILRHNASIFDALGVLVPSTLPLKILLQELVKSRLDWDTLIPNDLLSQWEQRLRDFHFPTLPIAVPRLAIPPIREGATIELHVFVDASQAAYAAVAYLVSRQSDGSGVSSLLAAKARVAPVKDTVTIPRMELLANLLGALLAHHVLKEMTTIAISATTVWTDSMITLCWIKNRAKKELPVFIRNRVTRICTLIPNATFNHIDGTLNPADVASRGCTSEELRDHPLWWQGPPFLCRPPSTWNAQPPISATISKETTMAAFVSDEPIEDPVPAWMDATRFGKWKKMVNSLIVVLLFSYKSRKIEPLPSRSSLFRKAEDLLFTMAQREYPPSPLLIQQLRMYRCSSTGLWRCHGRIDNAEISDEAKNPVYLPRESSTTRLYIMHRHEAVHHFGEQHTLIDLRQRVWIPKGISTVKSALRHCMACKRTKARPFHLPEFPDLPTTRTVVPSHPFSAVGLDLAGPLYYRAEDGRRKCWIVLFTCLHTRATYLDVICDMSTRTLLSRLRRFVAMYGAPSMIYTDNAPSFVALGQLQSAFQDPEEHDEIVDYCAQRGIEFKFITPFAPWSGGVYERLVGLTKSALKAVIGNRAMELEELDTLLKECEAVLNTRPLTTYTGSDADFIPLRPVDFLRPKACLSLPRLKAEEDGDEDDDEWRPRQALSDTLIDGWKRSTALLSRFWMRWQKEYLTSLRERFQRDHRQGRLITRATPQCNDVVLIAEDGLERGQWKLARIVTINGDRSAVVKTSTGTLHRPLSLLYKLEIGNSSTTEEPSADTTNDRPTNDGVPTPSPTTSTPAVRRSARHNPVMVALFAVSLLVFPASAVPDAKCPDASSARPRLVYVTPCSPNGIGVARIDGTADIKSRICWTRLQCPRGHLRLSATGNGSVCGPECPCPKWTHSCSHYMGRYRNESVQGKLPQELRDYLPPDVCSFKKTDHCAASARYGLFSQVELMDGTLHIVPQMDLSSTDTFSADDYRCVDIDGKELLPPMSTYTATGTSAFCTTYNCTSPEDAKAFCFYGGRVTSLVFLDKRIPLRAWGYHRTLYYPHPASVAVSRAEIVVVCGRLGAEAHPPNNAQEVALKACVSTQCVFLQEWLTDAPTPIIFPWSIVSSDYEIVVQQWTGGVSHPEYRVQCRGRSTCERLRCRFCSSFLWSPSCWSDIDAVLILFALLMIGGFISHILNLCKIISSLIGCFIGCFRRALCCLLRRSTGDPLSGVQTSARFYAPRKFRWRRRALHIALFALSLLFTSAHACSEVTSVRAEEHECTRSEDGSLQCAVSHSSILSLRPIGQETCLVVRDTSGAIGSIISLRVNHITHRCDKQTMYYTRSHTFHTKSHHVCGDLMESGACDGIRCSGLDPRKELPFFESTFPGYNVCASSCSCVTCHGCVTCTPSCSTGSTSCHCRTLSSRRSDVCNSSPMFRSKQGSKLKEERVPSTRWSFALEKPVDGTTSD